MNSRERPALRHDHEYSRTEVEPSAVAAESNVRGVFGNAS